MTTLISFLGRSNSDRATGYRKLRYRFENGHVEEVPYIGLALLGQLKPDRLVLLGTSGSMWDVFFDHLGSTEHILELVEAAEASAVTQELLKAHEAYLTAKLGVDVHCELIGYGRNNAEQADILRSLANCIPQGEQVYIDITHGYRHLPMLALVAARYLHHIRGVEVSEVYYGAEQMKDEGFTPVLRLGGMLQMLNWLEGFAVFQHSGYYGQFADLLEQDGMPGEDARRLRLAAHLEYHNDAAQALTPLRSAVDRVKQHNGTLGALFRDALVQRMSWHEQRQRQERDLAIADRYLKTNDYLRATIFLFEAFVTRCVMKQMDYRNPDDYDVRNEARKRALDTSAAARRLDSLRNALAHGVRGENQQEISRLLRDESRLLTELRRLRRELFRD